MVDDRDISTDLASRVRDAVAKNEALYITGADTKSFFTGQSEGTPLHIGLHQGIVAYEPTELVITARAGTPLAAIESVLATGKQMFAFEPPHFGDGATLGGTIACGFSGPRRPYVGAARDFVLGVKIINGKGEILSFGGQVMKNVAGYDVSRLMCGSLGTLGVILEVSLKVLPRPEAEMTLQFEMSRSDAITRMNQWAAQPLPLSATCYGDNLLSLRLSGSNTAITAAHSRLGGDEKKDGANYWIDLKEHRLDFFNGDTPLWRLSVPPATPMPDLPGKWLLDWGGAQRWLKTDAPGTRIREAVQRVGGHATLFRGETPGESRFHPMPAAMQSLQQRIKFALDPAGVFNCALAQHIIGQCPTHARMQSAV